MNPHPDHGKTVKRYYGVELAGNVSTYHHVACKPLSIGTETNMGRVVSRIFSKPPFETKSELEI